jgi:hypothetical protein
MLPARINRPRGASRLRFVLDSAVQPDTSEAYPNLWDAVMAKNFALSSTQAAAIRRNRGFHRRGKAFDGLFLSQPHIAGNKVGNLTLHMSRKERGSCQTVLDIAAFQQTPPSDSGTPDIEPSASPDGLGLAIRLVSASGISEFAPQARPSSCLKSALRHPDLGRTASGRPAADLSGALPARSIVPRRMPA